MLLDRRALILGTASMLASLSMRPAMAAESDARGLGAYAAAQGLLYGAAVRAQNLNNDILYQNAVLRECRAITPENEMKWGMIEQKQGVPNYIFADGLAQFAEKNKLILRGHTLVWGVSAPGWLPTALSGPGGANIVEKHIIDMMSRYAGRVGEWDVVNEALAPPHRRPDGLRNNIFLDTLGPDYIANAFHIARSCDPKALLYYNDFGFEYDDNFCEPRRQFLLKLLADLVARKVPIDGVGLQTHLKVGLRFNGPLYRRFLADIAAMGLRIMLTEIDVNDTDLPFDQTERDAGIAGHIGQVLDVALDEPAVVGLITWGLTTRLSWLNSFPQARKDGQQMRGLPLDAEQRHTPLWTAMVQSIKNAPARRYQSRTL